ESVSAGRRHAGMEHWLPLFHDEMASIFDLLPEGAVLALDHAIDDATQARFASIVDHFTARAELLAGSADEQPYRPLSPTSLYLSPEEWKDALADWPCLALDPFLAPDGVLTAAAKPILDFAEARARSDGDLYEAVSNKFSAAGKAKQRAVLAASSLGALDRLKKLIGQDDGFRAIEVVTTIDEAMALPKGVAGGLVAEIERGFETSDLVLVTEADILGERMHRRQRRRRRADAFLTEASDITEGDLVVHLDHGIGRYEGLETVKAGGAPHDCLRITYGGGDRLFVPVENIDVLSRFGQETEGTNLDRLGGAQWQARRAKMKQRIREMAEQLIAVAATRLVRPAEKLEAPEGVYEEFAARFPFDETDDQLNAIAEVMGDLTSGRPMDRLICGDVGFGKTEVALRATLVAAMSGRQVAVVAPTTLLVRQHFATFSKRFAGLPVEVRQLSRLVTSKDATATRKGLQDGTVDIVIGTHALLAKTISIPNLGLLIVDEEQRFGVAHKERLKQLKADVHVLTLTATPIPRTLQMALAGVREMSVIATPPVDRLAVRTFVGPYDNLQVKEAIQRERFRGGQTFYVAPRVRDLDTLVERVTHLVPDIRSVVAHGQLAPTQLEDVMSSFYEGRYDVLISTNIVESGLDIPTANTLLIHRADRFGLAQLYQLRGRVGRGKERGYAYLTVPEDRIISKTAQRRLEVMQTLDALGAGFTLASHDLDIRGGGNLLGDEQSGHIREVGVELYQQMLEEAVAAARAGDTDITPAEEAWSPQINLGGAVLIPEAYVKELNVRLGLYRRLSILETELDLEAFAAELVDRFGSLPSEVENLLEVMSVKQLCRRAHVAKLDVGPKGAVASFHNEMFPNPVGLVQYLTQQMGSAKLRPDNKLVITRAWEERSVRTKGVKRVLQGLAELAGAA
ncbi:MAG: transcription-repair coupling factor, partial [Alphaproteobacteria bacterium]